MAEGKGVVAGFATFIGTGKRSSAPGSKPNPISSPSSGSTGDKSADPAGKISGTRGSFNVKGDGSAILVRGAINSGYCSGSANGRKAAVQDPDPLEGCCGTDRSFNVEAGGKIIVAGGNICSGAFAGDGIERELFRTYAVLTANCDKQGSVPVGTLIR